MTGPQQQFVAEAPALIGVGAEAIVERAKSLGIQWTIRPATASTYSSGIDAVAIFDGDSVALNMVNLTGSEILVHSRLMVMIVPPAGNYIISQSYAHIGLGYQANDSKTTQVVGIGAEATVLTITRAIFVTQRAYEVKFRFSALTTTGTNAVIWRIRQSSGVGTLLGVGVWALRNVQSNYVIGDIIIINNTKNNIVDNLVLTLQASLATITMDGNATEVAWLRLDDYGPAAAFSASAASVA